MNIQSIEVQLKSKKLDSFYIFCGDEWALQSVYVRKIAQTAGLALLYINSVSQALHRIRTSLLFAKTFCYVVRDDKVFLTDENVQDELGHTVLGKNIVIILLNSVDKRTKFYDRYKHTVIPFDSLNTQILSKYIQQAINLSSNRILKLTDVCENSYGRCLLEVDKIKRYQDTTDLSVDQCFDILLKDGTLHVPPRDALFDFVDAVLSHDVNKSFFLYQQCKDTGEAVLVLITVLYNNFKALLQVQTCDSSDVERVTGLQSWQVKSVRKNIGKYNKDTLINILFLLQNIESGIKRGVVEENFAIDYILTEVL